MRTGTVVLLMLMAGAIPIGASGLPAEAVPPGSPAAVPATLAAAVDSISEVAILSDDPFPPHDQFGRHVGIDGDTAIVGAFDHDLQHKDSGAAYIFERNQGGVDNWGRVKKLVPIDDPQRPDEGFDLPEVNGGDQFGIRVAISGDVAVVGAFADEFGSGANAGTAYVFERHFGGLNNWGQVRQITAIDPAAGDQFGKAVAIDGFTIVVGAVFKDAGQAQAVGAAYVYERDLGGTANWGFSKKIVASDGTANDQFGVSVGISGDTIVVGAYAEDGPFNLTGAAYVFERNAGGSNMWGEVKKLRAHDPENPAATPGGGDQFGFSVAVARDVVVAGAFGHNHGVADAGAAYVFHRDQGGPGNWGLVKELLASDRQANDQFGFSVGVSSTGLAVIGAYVEDVDGIFQAGSAYLFDRNLGGGDAWGETGKLVPSDIGDRDYFGYATAVSGGRAIVGAPYNILATDREPGNAYVFDLPGGTGALRFFIADARPFHGLPGPVGPIPPQARSVPTADR